MTELQLFFLIVLSPVAVYGLVRVVTAAYFASKASFLKRFFRGGTEDDGR